MTLKELYLKFAKLPEGQWIMQPANAQELYNFIKKHNFKKILSLGTGIGASDAIICLALQDKGIEDYHIDSIEQYDKCIRIAKELIPEEFKKHITFYKTEPAIWNHKDIAHQDFSIYKELPNDDYDLIINDGPSPFIENDLYVDIPNGTIQKLTVEGKLKPGTIIIYDGRIASLNLLERYFSDNFFVTYIPPKNGDFNVLEKKDNELKIVDQKLGMMKELTSYFKNHEDFVSRNK